MGYGLPSHFSFDREPVGRQVPRRRFWYVS
nr:MAG TPA: hypothetical protein [Caudoviricetes sp.]